LSPPAPRAEGLRVGPGTLLWTLSLAQLVSWGILFYGFAVLVVPMEAELGWSKTTLNAGLSVGLVVSGLFAPWIGVQIDRGRAHLVMTAGSLLGTAALLGWAAVGSPTVYFAMWVALGVAMACTLYEPGFAVLVKSLGERAPRAILQMTFIGGLASTVFIPLTHGLIEMVGWRWALATLAAVNLLAAALPHALVLRPALGATPLDAAPRQAGGVSARAAMADARFWGFLVCFASYQIAFTALAFHLLPLLDERGIDRTAGVALYTFIGPMQVTGRLLLLAVEGRVSMRGIGRAIFAAAVPMILMLLAAGADLRLLALFIIVYGIINGLHTVVRGTIVREVFGPASFGAIQGRLTLPANVARAAGPSVGALLWALFGAYGAVLLVLAAVFTVSAAAFWYATRARPAP
jgi:MFS family permease